MKRQNKRTGTKSEPPVHLLACGVFKTVVEYLQLTRKFPRLHPIFLPTNLHLQPQELKERFLKEIAVARSRGEPVVCLYGNCFPDIEECCRQLGTIKVPGQHCYEMLLGSERFRRLQDETAGTFFLEKDLLANFEQYCLEPLELYDEEMRACCFKNYRKLLYIRQPRDPDLVAKADSLARFLDLYLEIQEADYSHLERQLFALISGLD